ncbi:MAG: PilZ domain-containing protein [Syntrophaceae bacterium]|nr:PilZ domain-containing protein [Syntrophaceae bacterium]
MNDKDTEFTDDKREYSRVDACVPLECKKVQREHRDTVRCRMAGESVLAEFKSLPNPEDQLIAQWLQSINAKLNEIIRMMTLQHEGFNCLSMTKINIGGGGMSFHAAQRFFTGDILELKLMLGLHPPLALFLYGEVVDASPPHPEFNTSIQFINLDEVIRGEIIRFVFETEREILRERRR